MIETRNTLGARVGRAVERTFRIDPEDFDADFRRWLRKKYLPELVETGEPADFGRPFRVEPRPSSAGAVAGGLAVGRPGGGLQHRQGRRRRGSLRHPQARVMRNLTKGFGRVSVLRGPGADDGPARGRDLAFSPDGNTVAFFARQDGPQPGPARRAQGQDHPQSSTWRSSSSSRRPGAPTAGRSPFAATRTVSSTSSRSTSPPARSAS